jgi:hypothetical protein
MPGSSRMQTTGVRLRDLACDLEQSLTVLFIFDGPGIDLWDALQLGYVGSIASGLPKLVYMLSMHPHSEISFRIPSS